MNSAYERLRQKYEEGNVPWDAQLPPPEVIALAAELAPGRALDLGCGYGRASIYLAQNGWQVDGVDFVAAALAVARQRAAAAGVQINLHQASVTDLSFLKGLYDLAVDVGCAHALDEEELAAYRDTLRHLLRPGATFLLFARLHPDSASSETATDAPPGLDEPLFHRLFAKGFSLEGYEQGVTTMPDNAWLSTWFRLRRGLLADG